MHTLAYFEGCVDAVLHDLGDANQGVPDDSDQVHLLILVLLHYDLLKCLQTFNEVLDKLQNEQKLGHLNDFFFLFQFDFDCKPIRQVERL